MLASIKVSAHLIVWVGEWAGRPVVIETLMYKYVNKKALKMEDGISLSFNTSCNYTYEIREEMKGEGSKGSLET
jgi:hypothetical protein